MPGRLSDVQRDQLRILANQVVSQLELRRQATELAPEMRARMVEMLHERGIRSFWEPPEDATPEQLTQFEAQMARMAIDPATITTRVDVSAFARERFAALQSHATQISTDNPLFALGPDAWQELGGQEVFVRVASSVDAAIPEADLFAGLDGA